MSRIKVGDKVKRAVSSNSNSSNWCSFLDEQQWSDFIVTSVDYPFIQINGWSWRGDSHPFHEGNFSLLFECVEPVTIVGTGPEYTGGSVDYYTVEVKNPTKISGPYKAECNDIIEALGMNYAEGNAFKALWRRSAHRTLGKKKAGASDDGLYDAEKVVFFGKRLVEQSKVAK